MWTDQTHRVTHALALVLLSLSPLRSGGLSLGSGADKTAPSGAPGQPEAKDGKEEVADGLFQLRPCQISLRTQNFMELVYQTLSESRNADPLAYGCPESAGRPGAGVSYRTR